MKQVQEFLAGHTLMILIVGVFLAIIILISLLKRFIKHQVKKKEITQAAEDRMRDENLNKVILNSNGHPEKRKEVYVPYDVDYNGGGQGKNIDSSGGKDRPLMLRLVERTELSTRKFVLNPSKRIRIGSDLKENDIPVLSEGVSERHCEIFLAGGKVYVKNLSQGTKTIIRRKKERAFADEKGIRLLSGDVLCLGSVFYDITILE